MDVLKKNISPGYSILCLLNAEKSINRLGIISNMHELSLGAVYILEF